MFHVLGFLILPLPFSSADTLYGQALGHCQFDDDHDAVYLAQFYFNKMLAGQYNSSVGKLIGYTKKTKELADSLNSNPIFVKMMKTATENCKRMAPLAYDGLLNAVEPFVRLRSVEAVGSKHPGMLLCSAYNFYPKQIRVTWLRNGKEVTSDVMSTDQLSNGNWFYQVHSYLEYTPITGEKISCMVEHASLMEPKLHDWEPGLDSGMKKIAVGTAGLLLGVSFSVAGLIYYMKKSTTRVLVPTTEGLYPEHTL